MDPIDNFRKNLAKILTTRKIKQVDVAREIGISASELNDFLKGRKGFSEERLCKICGAIQVEFSDMVSESYMTQEPQFDGDDVKALIQSLSIVSESLRRAELKIEKLESEIEALRSHQDPQPSNKGGFG